MNYSITDFHKEYPDEDACLKEVFKQRYGRSFKCPDCKRDSNFYRVSGRKCYACQYCGHQLHPLAGTIFHKSPTPLKLWFYAIFLFSASRNGVSAMELKRHLSVTYKTAWRMAHQIRKLMEQDGDDKLDGTVEADETYIGGKRHGKRGRGAAGKTPVFGAIKRGGKVIAKAVPNVREITLLPIIKENVSLGSKLMTDEMASYKKAKQHGFDHHTVRHAIKEYVRGKVHTNTIEGFWAQLKRSIDGTYHSISSKHLQAYLDEFVFRHNRREDEAPIFFSLLGAAWKPS